jgi:hypothetical protein
LSIAYTPHRLIAILLSFKCDRLTGSARSQRLLTVKGVIELAVQLVDHVRPAAPLC